LDQIGLSEIMSYMKVEYVNAPNGPSKPGDDIHEGQLTIARS